MRRRKVWIVLSIVLGVVLLGAAWAGWTAYRVNGDLGAAVDDVADLRSAIETGDDAEADEALARLESHSGSAADKTDGFTWALLERLPMYGDDASGVAIVSSVIDDLTSSGIRPLVEMSGDLDSLVPH